MRPSSLGLGRTREEVKKQRAWRGVSRIFSRRFTRQLAPYNKRLLFWGDMAVNSPELVGTLPKDMIAVPWRYDAEPDFTPLIRAVHQGGTRDVGCAGSE